MLSTDYVEMYLKLGLQGRIKEFGGPCKIPEKQPVSSNQYKEVLIWRLQKGSDPSTFTGLGGHFSERELVSENLYHLLPSHTNFHYLYVHPSC